MRKLLVFLVAAVLYLMLRLRRAASKLYINANDQRMKRILSSVDGCNKSGCALKTEVGMGRELDPKEHYRAPWWCCNTWLNVAVMVIKEKWEAHTLPMRRERLIQPDGGEVSVDYADDEVTRALPADAPILGILHTITGSSGENAGFLKYAASRGWRSCVLNRRGHSGMPLRPTTSGYHWSIMGHIDDSVAMVANIRERHPSSFIALAGISAGSGQVVSYIGREGKNTPIGAAASLCPSWDIRQSFRLLREHYPMADQFVTRAVQKHFLGRLENQTALNAVPSEVVIAARGATNLEDLVEASVPFAACSDLDQFFQENNPMNYASGNATPTLILNALDDFLCIKENIRYDLVENSENYLLMVTDEGSHIGYTEGTFGQGNYMHRITLDFFDAVRAVEHETPSGSHT